MKKIVIITVVILLLVCTGCSYTVTPKPDAARIYNPFMRPYPYKVALVLDDEFKRTYYSKNIGGDTASYKFVPALQVILKGSLRNAFREIVIVSAVSEKHFDKEKIDIAIFPKITGYDIDLPLEDGGMLGTYTSFLELDIGIYDWQGNGIDKMRIRGEGTREGTTRPQSPWGYKKAVKSGEYDPDQAQFAHNQWQVSSRAIEDACSKLLEEIKKSPTIQDYLGWLRNAKEQMAQSKEGKSEKTEPPVSEPKEAVSSEPSKQTGTQESGGPPPQTGGQGGGSGIQ